MNEKQALLSAVTEAKTRQQEAAKHVSASDLVASQAQLALLKADQALAAARHALDDAL